MEDSERREVGGFTFYRSYFDAIAEMGNEERLQFYDALTEYAFCGVVPELQGILKSLWSLAKPNLDHSIENYVNGKKGGRPRKGSEPQRETPLNNPPL